MTVSGAVVLLQWWCGQTSGWVVVSNGLFDFMCFGYVSWLCMVKSFDLVGIVLLVLGGGGCKPKDTKSDRGRDGDWDTGTEDEAKGQRMVTES